MSVTTSTVIVDPSQAVPAVPAPPARPPARPVRRVAQGREMRRQAMLAGGFSSGGSQIGWNGYGYSGAGNNALNRDWTTAHMAADAAIQASWDNLTRRARDLARNEPWAGQAIERIVQNVIGDEGFGAEAEVEIDGELDEDANSEIDAWYQRWAEEADAEGRMHLAEMQALAMSEAVEVGQCFLVAVNLPDKDRTIPLAYQLIEAEQLNTTLDWPTTAQGGPIPETLRPGESPAGLIPGNRIRRGIEFDNYHRVAAYHFWAAHPYDFQITAQRTIRVPADRVIHLYRRKRPSQTQGITWFAPILQALRDLSQYIGDEMTAASIGAKFVVAIKRAVGVGTGLGFAGDGSDDGIDANGNPLEELGPGIIADLHKDDAIEMIESKRPNSASEPWIKLILESMANGIGLTYLGLTGDVTRASFSSARFARLQDKTFWRTLQGHFGRTVVVPQRRAAIRQLVAMRRITAVTPTQFAQQPHRWLACRLLPHGWEEIQVLEEVTAAVQRVQAGFSTMQQEIAGRGHNWRRIFKQRARELAYAEQLGLSLSVDRPPPGSAPLQAEESGEGSQSGAEETDDAEEGDAETDVEGEEE